MTIWRVIIQETHNMRLLLPAQARVGGARPCPSYAILSPRPRRSGSTSSTAGHDGAGRVGV
jgi:hypothetical protein